MNSKNRITGVVYFVSDTLVDWVDKGKIQSIDNYLFLAVLSERKRNEDLCLIVCKYVIV
jgi:hypothetical protein